MLDRAQRRLMTALGVSVLLHVWFAHTAQGLHAPSTPRTATGSGIPITVLFYEPPADSLIVHSTPSVARVSSREIVQPAAAAIQGAVAAPKTIERPVVTLVAATANGSATLPQPSDPTYYSALSLDVYPKAATGLDLSAYLAAGSYTTGQVRATVLIDEFGIVNEVRAIKAVASDIESAARDLLLHTRFTPARKDGRIVKAQVRISLDYGSR